jgi:hypothetical protein
MRAKSRAGWRAYWEPELSVEELAEVNRLERVILDGEAELKRVVTLHRKALSHTRKLRQRIVNKGIGRARWKLIGRAEHMANKANRLAALGAANNLEKTT